MKLLLIALVLTPAAAVASLSSSEEFLADIKHDHDAQEVMEKMQGMMAASQQKLGVAERHHKKVVKKIRKEADAFLQDESSVYGKYLNSFAAELTASREELKGVVAAAKAGIAKAESKSTSVNDWKDPTVEQRAKLNAQVTAAERNIKRAERKQSRQVREGEERAEENMEDEASKLGLKLGDMTPLVDKAKKNLETVAEKEVPVPAAPVKNDKSDKVDLKALQDDLSKAVSKDQQKVRDANKRLDNFLAKTGKDVADKTAKIQGDLEVAQKKEIEQVIGRKPETKPAPAVKKVEKVVAKAPAKEAAPAKTTEVKKETVPVKAAPVKQAEVKAAAVPAKAAPVKQAEVKAAAVPAKAAPVKPAEVKAVAVPAKAKK